MIKSIFINNRIKKSKSAGDHGSYTKSERIGILYNADEFGPAAIYEVQMILERDKKFVSKLGFSSVNTKELSSSSEVDFTKKDISSTGSIKNDIITKFIEKPFDFLISLDTSEDINYKYVLASSKAACKVGFQTDAYQNILMMFMKLSKDKSKSVNDLISYLKKI